MTTRLSAARYERNCLLLDVYMPGMNGVELCRNLVASGRHLPTILISGRDDRQTRQMMREANSIASLLKPFDEENCYGRFGKRCKTARICRIKRLVY